MRRLIFFICLFHCFLETQAQYNTKGTVISAIDNMPLAGATVAIEGYPQNTITDVNGEFNMVLADGKFKLAISMLGYQSNQTAITVPISAPLLIKLNGSSPELDEVTIVSTGYYDIPKERITGSFVQINNRLLNQNVSTDIISKLEGLTNSLTFDKRKGNEGRIRVRGLSTLHADYSPLIVLDNFPYEGDVNNINPNEVETVSILRDAAAASIWGARAANGVIVITTKKGTYGQAPQFSFNSSITVSQKPDLYYNRDFLSSPQYIEVERELFNLGSYNSAINNNNLTPLTPVIELLLKEKVGKITQAELNSELMELSDIDLREEATKHLYRNAVNQQYAFNLVGGGNSFKYSLFGGYDQNLENVKKNAYERINFNSLSSYKFFDRLEATAGIGYLESLKKLNGLDINGLNPVGRRIYPYAKLIDETGGFLPIEKNHRLSFAKHAIEHGFLEWQFKPLQEINLIDNTYKTLETRINAGLNYKLFKDIDIDVKYQYQTINGKSQTLYDKDSYHVRDLVNQFTQPNNDRIFPNGDILKFRNNVQVSHLGRAQLNYKRRFNANQLYSLVGAEIRQASSIGNGHELYGYDHNILTHQSRLDYNTRYPKQPWGAAQLPLPSVTLIGLIDRFVSYYSNVSYSFDNRYVFSGSARWDASNLFGVRTNQKGVPLWSLGGSWNISEEDFYRIDWLAYLKVRTTYGYNGNVNKSVSAFTTARFGNDWMTGLQNGRIMSPGNPELRWEKTKVINAAIEFGTKRNRIQGSLDLYIKTASDLLGNEIADPTTGYDTSPYETPYMVNYAEMKTSGFDLDIRSINLTGKFIWSTNWLLSYSSSKVKNYKGDYSSIPLSVFTVDIGARPINGRSPDAIYSFPWLGLSSIDGSPVIPEDFSNYSNYMGSLTMEDLEFSGVTVPPVWGAVRNSIQWKNLELSLNLSWKGGYKFRRSSVNYSRLYSHGEMHSDYSFRWQKSGDELFSNTPSMPKINDSNRNTLYTGSSVLIAKGDHIRLENLNLSYSIINNKNNYFNDIRVFIYTNNLGILWRANKFNLDPDSPNTMYPRSKSISLGLNMNL